MVSFISHVHSALITPNNKGKDTGNMYITDIKQYKIAKCNIVSHIQTH